MIMQENVKNSDTERDTEREIQTITALNEAELKHVTINKQGTKKTQVNKMTN